MTQICNYEEARSLICDGDLLSFRHKKGSFRPLQRLTELVTNSSYYHTGIAVWLTSVGGVKRLFICEAHGSGRRLVPISIYANRWFDVTKSPVEFAKIEGPMLERVGSMRYGFKDFIAVGMRNVFGIVMRNSSGEICSEMAQNLYTDAGVIMSSVVLAPDELKEFINGIGFDDRVHIR